MRCSSVDNLMLKYPSLNSATAIASEAVAVKVEEEGDGRRYSGAGCVVLTASLRARRERPACTNIPCRTRRSFCIHSCAVKAPLARYAGWENGPECPGESDCADEEADGADKSGSAVPPAAASECSRLRPAAPNARRKRYQRVFIDTNYRRRARNMLRCAIETASCRRWAMFARRHAVAAAEDLALFEAVCTTCGAETNALGVGVAASLHTLCGVSSVRTHRCKCTSESCGKKDTFDESQQGLFCYSDNTLYTRALLDVILFTIISSKSSISAASAVLAFHLHCSGAVGASDAAQSRQELSKATDQCSRNLIVLRQRFKCVRCYSFAGQPYIAIIVDGQTIGIFCDSFFPFENDTANVPTIPISIDNASAIPMAKVRKCARQRPKAA